MKVILLQDVPKLGKKGEVIDVAEGYGRNYLIPRNLATEASQGKLNELAELKKAENRKKKQIEEEAKELAEKLKEIRVELTAKVGDAGKLFGAISNKDIADHLKKEHKIKVDKKKIVLKSPIKNLGSYNVTVKLHPKVQIELQVVVSEG
ncbi:50S ribosomal protein L9 [Desulfofalx alkaliphila]|uniref:50S ribosomal protein L9 n=1 Tax=Desulfofalx alkaliphila TaxID=105483 RepID=UPI0004E211F1|nr:50S ribosomal protein L9 [Desulfofalx alkaliphila]